MHLQLTSLTSDCHEPVKVRQVYNVVTNNIQSPRHSPQQFLGHPISENHHMVVFWKVLLKTLIPQFPTALMVSFRNVNCTMRQFCINRNKETTNIKNARDWPVFYVSPRTQGTCKYSQWSLQLPDPQIFSKLVVGCLFPLCSVSARDKEVQC